MLNYLYNSIRLNIFVRSYSITLDEANERDRMRYKCISNERTLEGTENAQYNRLLINHITH